MSVCFRREGHNLTHSHYQRYSGNFESHEPETYLFLCAQCPSSWCFLDIPPLNDFWAIAPNMKIYFLPVHSSSWPRPRKHYHQLHGLIFLFSPTCCLQWPRRSCDLAFILSLHPTDSFLPPEHLLSSRSSSLMSIHPAQLWYTDLSTVEFARTLHLRESYCFPLLLLEHV